MRANQQPNQLIRPARKQREELRDAGILQCQAENQAGHRRTSREQQPQNVEEFKNRKKRLGFRFLFREQGQWET